MTKAPHLDAFIDYLKTVDDSKDSKLGFDMNRGFFDQGSSSYPCGSACCLGGHAVFFILNKLNEETKISDLPRALSKVTGLSLGNADDVCFPQKSSREFPWTATLQDAIYSMERFRETGTFTWLKFDSEGIKA